MLMKRHAVFFSILVIFTIIVAFGVGFLFGQGVAAPPADPSQTGIACTEEAMICPDGSAVGREAPDCAFAPCPGDTPAKP